MPSGGIPEEIRQGQGGVLGTGETQPRAAELAVGRRWTFGPAVLDERTLELTVNGEPARVERKPLEVLLYLLHHAGEVVTKDELADNLWPGRILTETVLTRCISQLRQVLKDEERRVIRTAHGFGYRLVAEVKVDATTAPAPPAFSFEPGQHPPLRPHWRLVERLGTGGHGEAWLAQQDKTRDQRVFKFALDAGGLAALKREITLYRLLNDTLGDRAPAVRLLEWNLEEAPYFIETEYVEGRDLSAWAAARGGLAELSLAQRLDLIAQIAEALGAAHSVGVLHKDLKPGNVLVCHSGRSEESPRIKLCDFGSGGVMDVEQLKKLGITSLGFTKTAATPSATPLYVAPEVMAGQPSTVAADIYALGVMLYQVVVGDFRKALAPGWELNISDELLCEDVAAAAAGDPLRRLADAAQLAERLRSLETRRKARAAEMAGRERAERTRKVQEELLRIRVYALLLLGVATVAIAGGVMAYRARNDALAATATAEAINDFLTEDVLRVSPGIYRTSQDSYESLLDRAAVEAGTRLSNQPKAAANIHLLLGRRYQEVGRFDVAVQQYQRAADLFSQVYGPASHPTLMALDRLAGAYLEVGQLSKALAICDQMYRLWKSQLPPTDLAIFIVRTRLARSLIVAGNYTAAERELREIVRDSPHATSSHESTMLFKDWYGITLPSREAGPLIVSAYADLLLAGNILEEFGESSDAESRLRGSLAVFSEYLGNGNELSTLAHMALAVVLTNQGSHDEAERIALQVKDSLDKTLPSGHFARAVPGILLGRIRLEQKAFTEALAMFQEAVDFCSRHPACPARMWCEFQWQLGRAHNELEHREEAIETLRAALARRNSLEGARHPHSLLIRITLADALRKTGKSAEARAVLAGDRTNISAIQPGQQTRADLRRVEGLLFLEEGEFGRARAALKDSLDILTGRLGANHWRTQRVRAELAQVP